MENSWARDQLSRYSEAAHRMRQAATSEGNRDIARRYAEIAERYEQLAQQTQTFC